MGSHRERDSPSRRAATRAPVDSQGGYTHLHFTVRTSNRDLCSSQLWNTIRSPKDAEPARSEMLAYLGASYLIVCLIHWYSGTICLSIPRWGPTMERRPRRSRTCVWEVRRRRVFSDDVFPAWKKLEELFEYRGTYVRLTERMHMFTRIVFIPIWRPGQFVVNTLKHWPLPDQAELSTGTPN